MGNDLTAKVLHILNDGEDPTDINKTDIVLIPKVKHVMHASEFWPISLCNMVFKLVTKTITNRLKRILLDIVGKNQSFFVPNRIIIDNALGGTILWV